MGKTALILWGGWEGHTPKETAALLADRLRERGMTVRVEHALAPLEEAEALEKTDLIVPVWTMDELSEPQWLGLNRAVHEGGSGLAGVHGSITFRGRVAYQWMVGGQFFGHPHVGEYTVEVLPSDSPITRDMPRRFVYKSEQYYLGMDPGVNVLASTAYAHEGRTCIMPVVWTKTWGKGRIFYSSLGHVAEEFRTYPAVLEMTVRGMLWAARDGSCVKNRERARVQV